MESEGISSAESFDEMVGTWENESLWSLPFIASETSEWIMLTTWYVWEQGFVCGNFPFSGFYDFFFGKETGIIIELDILEIFNGSDKI